MRIKRFRDWSIFTKIMSISVVTIIVVTVGMLAYFIPYIESKVMEEKRLAIKSVVDISFALMTEYDERAKKGEFSQKEAQQRVATRVKNLRYRGQEYLWINDLTPAMVMHPFKPELNGKDLSDFQDPNGKKLFVEMVKVSKEKGEGFVDYMWPKPGASASVPKISYVKLYQPWGWIIGSGVYVDDVVEQLAKFKAGILLATALCSLLILSLAFGISWLITRPLKQGVSFANRMAGGDFTASDLAVKSADEAGALARALNKTKQGLNAMLQTAMGQVSRNADEVSAASRQLSESVGRITDRLGEQAGRASQVATAAEEMSQTVLDIARTAASIAESAAETKNAAEGGQGVVQRTIEEVGIISKSVRESAERIGSLNERSRQIVEIVGLIQDIADQTNLLALNAAIEAARAGEHGRGFSVVADEVRKLAEKTVKATAQISEMIQLIQDETGRVVDSMEQSQQGVERGVALSGDAGLALNTIVESVKGLQSMVQQIASATEEMSATSEQISSDIEAIADVSRATTGTASEIEAASSSLSRLSETLQEVVSKFKV